MKRELILCAVCAAACSREVTIALPYQAGEASALLAIEEGGKLSVYAFDAQGLKDGASKPLSFTSEDTLSMTALLYPQTLEEQSLAAGPVPPATASDVQQQLPSTSWQYAARLEGTDLYGWTAVQTISDAVSMFTTAAPPPKSVCDGISIATVAFPGEGAGFRRVALISAEEAYTFKVNMQSGVLRIRRSGPLEPVPIAGLSVAADLVSDHHGTTYVSGIDDRVFQIDDGGAVIAETHVPYFAARLAIDQAGTAYAYGPELAVPLVRGSTTTGPMFLLPDRTVGLLVVSPERMAAVSRTSIYGFDGEVWAEEVRSTELELGMLFGDDTLIGYVHQSQGVLLRNDMTMTWSHLDDPSPGAILFSARALGRGRALVMGDAGIAAIHDASGWCDLDTSTLRALQTIDSAPELHVVLAGSLDTNAQQTAVWLDLPATF